jgi:hypothetical protein
LEQDAEVVELVGASDDDNLGTVGDMGGVNTEWRALLLGDGVGANEWEVDEEEDETVLELDGILGFFGNQQNVSNIRKRLKEKGNINSVHFDMNSEVKTNIQNDELDEYVKVVGDWIALGNNLYIPRVHPLLMPSWVENEENIKDDSDYGDFVDEDDEEKEVKCSMNVHHIYDILMMKKYRSDSHMSFLLTTNFVYLHRMSRISSVVPILSNGRSLASTQKPNTKVNTQFVVPELRMTHAIEVVPVRYSMFFYYLLLPLYKQYHPSFVPAFGLIVALNLVFELIMRKYVYDLIFF